MQSDGKYHLMFSYIAFSILVFGSLVEEDIIDVIRNIDMFKSEQLELARNFVLGFFSSSKNTLKNRSTIFTLGDRACVLTTELEDPVIVPHAAAKSDKKVGEYCSSVTV